MEINKPISAVVIMAIASTIFFLFAFPKYKESRALDADLAKKQLMYGGRVHYYAKLADVLGKIEQDQEALRKVESALPSNFQLAPVVQFLEQKAKDSELTVQSIAFSGQDTSEKQLSNKDSPGHLKNMVLDVEVSGTGEGLKTFLYSLETSARLFEINSIAFLSSQKNVTQSALAQYAFSLEIAVFTY